MGLIPVLVNVESRVVPYMFLRSPKHDNPNFDESADAGSGEGKASSAKVKVIVVKKQYLKDSTEKLLQVFHISRHFIAGLNT